MHAYIYMHTTKTAIANDIFQQCMTHATHVCASPAPMAACLAGACPTPAWQTLPMIASCRDRTRHFDTSKADFSLLICQKRVGIACMMMMTCESPWRAEVHVSHVHNKGGVLCMPHDEYLHIFRGNSRSFHSSSNCKRPKLRTPQRC